MADTTVAGLTLSRAGRRTLLAVHVITSVGWLGVSAVLLTVSLTAVLTDSTDAAAAAYWTEHLLGPLLVVPLSLLSFVTGVLLGVGTKWGLVRHVWVLVKLVLTTVAVLLTLFVLLHQIDLAYAHSRPGVDRTVLGRTPGNLRDAGLVSTALYTFVTVVSVLKPWGLTRWGRARRSRLAGAARR